MSKKVTEELEPAEFKDFSITIENMKVGKDVKLCLIVKYFDPETEKYSLFESKIPKTSVLGKEVSGVLKEVKATLKAMKKAK